MSLSSLVVSTLYVNTISFADQDMFARYAAIGVGHDAVHSRRHAYGLVGNHLAANNEDDDEFEGPLSCVSGDDGDVKEGGDKGGQESEEGEGDGDSDGSASDDSVDSDFDVCF